MNPRPFQRRNRLLACLVFLPALLLAGVGVHSLRQDRALVRLEAIERSQRLAEDLRDAIASALTDPQSTGSHHAVVFRLDAAGDLSSPPSYPAVPVPTPLPLDSLNEEQRRLAVMEDATTPGTPGQAGEGRTIVLDQFLATHPPESMAAMARYRAGLWHAGQGDVPRGAALLEEVLDRHPGATGETGLPLAPLAALRLLEWHRPSDDTPATPLIESLCSNAVWFPSLLTPQLLASARRAAQGEETNIVTRWERTWAEHELSRNLHAAIREDRSTRAEQSDPGDPRTPSMFWVSLSSSEVEKSQTMPAPASLMDSRLVPVGNRHEWLAVRRAAPDGGTTYQCWAAQQLAVWIESPPAPQQPRMSLVVTLPAGQPPPEWPVLSPPIAGIRSVLERMPPYLGVTLDVAGRRFGHDGFDPNDRVLASAVAGDPRAGTLAVRVHLVDPRLLFARQRTRTLWFGSLIGLSVAAVGVGFLAVWRAWRKQERLADMKSNFVSSVSHELRAPIASVRLLAEGLEQGQVTDPERRQQYHRFIVQECRRLSAMVENVLDISRIEQDRKEYEFEPADVAALTADTVQRLAPCSAEAGVRLVFEMPSHKGDGPPTDGSAWHATVDTAALQQALVNLLDNAIKHSPREGRITVALARSPDDTAMRWSVTDQGPGIPPAERLRVFERFYRIGSELHRNTPGVGIGLNIVQHIAEAHRGKVWIEEGDPCGARVVMEVPIGNAQQPSPA